MTEVTKNKNEVFFIGEDTNTQERFEKLMSLVENKVTYFSTGLAAIQHLKRNKLPSLIIIEENVKPLGALQTLNYFKDQFNYDGQVFVVSENQDPIYSETVVYRVLSNQFSAEDKIKLKAVINFSDEPDEPVEPAVGDYSLTYLRNLSEGDESFVVESIRIFNYSVGERIIEMQSLLQQNDFKQIGDVAHNIKPSFEMLENRRGKDFCDRLAHHAENEEVGNLIKLLDIEFRTIQNHLKNDLPEIFITT